jgi:hypothetical protein
MAVFLDVLKDEERVLETFFDWAECVGAVGHVDGRAWDIILFEFGYVLVQLPPEVLFALCVCYFRGGVTLDVAIATAMFAAGVDVDAVSDAGGEYVLICERAVPLDDTRASGRYDIES